MNLEVGASHVGLSWILAEKRLSPEQCDNRTPLSPLCWTQPPPARWPGLFCPSFLVSGTWARLRVGNGLTRKGYPGKHCQLSWERAFQAEENHGH